MCALVLPSGRKHGGGTEARGWGGRAAGSAEVLALSSVGRGFAGQLGSLDEVEAIEAFGQFAGLRVAQPHEVPDRQVVGRRTVDRRLDLAGALGAAQGQPLG